MKEDKIFTAYINEMCPVCGAPVDEDSSTMDHAVNGKFVAREYLCEYCLSEYRVSMGRGLRNIESEILVQRGGEI